MRPALCLAIGLLVLASVDAATAAQDRRALLDLRVNLVSKGEVLVVLRGTEVLVRTKDLSEAGLRSFGGTRETIRGEEFTVLSSLAPSVDYQLDETNLRLDLTARPDLLNKSRINLGSVKPADITYSHETSGFLNYSLNLRQFNEFDGFVEGGIVLGNALLYSSGFRTDQGQYVRGLSNLTIDEPNKLTTCVLGDQLASSSDPLGGALYLAGIGYSRNFSLDPYFVRFPTQNLSGALATPSRVDVYVNGYLVKEEALPPGQFQLNNLPLSLGSGATQVVVRDALGNQTQINSPYYLSTQVLSEGLSEFSYDIGLSRANYSTSSFDYREPALVAHHRYGLTDWITPGFRLEANLSVVSGGPLVDVKLPWGTVELSAAESEDRGVPGSAAAFSYSYFGPISFGGTVQARSTNYANLSLTSRDDRPREQASIFAGLPLGSSITVTPEYTYSDFRDAGRQDLLSLGFNMRLSERISLFISASRSRQQHPPQSTNEAFISLTYFFGHQTTGSVAYDQTAHTGSPSIAVQKALPYGPGYGYRVQAATGGPGNQFNGDFQYQGNYGIYEADYGRVGNQDTTTLGVAGGLVALGERLFATRPVQQGYALIRVPGVENVRGYLSNQEVGRSDSNGDLLVPNLLPYYGNLLSIADKDIPIDYSVDALRRTVAPPNRGGAVVSFPVHRLRAFMGKLKVLASGKEVIPALGELTLSKSGKSYESPVGNHGEFYIDNAPPGAYSALIEFAGGECRFTVDLPDSKEALVKLGLLTCVQDATHTVDR